jgi:hypothetical protein
MDAANRASYPRTGTTATDTIENTSGILNGTTFENINSGVFNFDGIDDKITIEGLSDFGGGSLTISFWIKSGIDANNAYVLMRSGFSFYIFQSGTSSNLKYRIQTSALNTISGGAILDNNWHYCVMTFDSAANKFKVFEDSTQVGSTATTSGALASSTSTVYLATFANGAPFKSGFIPNIHIYNRALSASEVLHNYNALKSRFGL